MRRVQVMYKLGTRAYTYEYDESELTLTVGDLVEVPVGESGSTSALVTEMGSKYSGPCKQVMSLLRQADPVWERIKQLQGLCDIQCSDGNWNYDPYMHGMANALLLALHVIHGKEGVPAFIESPESWLADSGAEQPAPLAGAIAVQQ